MLEFDYSNQIYFYANQKVELKVNIKNVSNFTVRVFEIDLETYYRKKKIEFNSEINLEGVIPNYSQVYKNTFPSIMKM